MTSENIVRNNEMFRLSSRGIKCEQEISVSEIGRIDILTDHEVIEVKQIKNWKNALGQVLAYSSAYPTHAKRIHLFGSATDNRIEKIRKICSQQNVTVSVESTDNLPFTIDQLTCDYIISRLSPVITKEAMEKGANFIADLMIKMLLKNDGKYFYWCEDESKTQFKMLIKSGGKVVVKDDPYAINLRTILAFPLRYITMPFAADEGATDAIMKTYDEIDNILPKIRL